MTDRSRTSTIQRIIRFIAGGRLDLLSFMGLFRKTGYLPNQGSRARTGRETKRNETKPMQILISSGFSRVCPPASASIAQGPRRIGNLRGAHITLAPLETYTSLYGLDFKYRGFTQKSFTYTLRIHIKITARMIVSTCSECAVTYNSRRGHSAAINLHINV